jgi:hypothetical protein
VEISRKSLNAKEILKIILGKLFHGNFTIRVYLREVPPLIAIFKFFLYCCSVFGPTICIKYQFSSFLAIIITTKMSNFIFGYNKAGKHFRADFET